MQPSAKPEVVHLRLPLLLLPTVAMEHIWKPRRHDYKCGHGPEIEGNSPTGLGHCPLLVGH